MITSQRKPCVFCIFFPECPPTPEIVDEVEWQRGYGDQGLAEQEVDVELLILNELAHESDVVEVPGQQSLGLDGGTCVILYTLAWRRPLP